GAPFSQFALFRSTNTNQNGWLLVFAGGNTAAQVQEIFDGPVHVNAIPHFFGAPVFHGIFSSTADKTDWWQGNNSDYSGSAVFNAGSIGGTPSVPMPSDLFNFVRLAAGDPSPGAGTDTTEPSAAQMETYLAENSDGTLTPPVVD